MDPDAWTLIGSKVMPLLSRSPDLPFRVVRSACALVIKPPTYERGVSLLTHLVKYKDISHKAKQLVYAGLETAGTLIMEGQKAGRVEVDEHPWREMLQLAQKEGNFSEHQKRNIDAWLNYDWATLVKSKKSSTAEWVDGAPKRLRLAETVLAARTNRFSLVLESLFDDFNQQAVIRTADCFGVQNIHVVSSPVMKQSHNRVSKSITKNVLPFMSIHEHKTTKECVEALRASGHQIWATDLSPEAIKFDPLTPDLVIPEKLAIVFGREISGCSEEILKAADKRIFVPIFGYAESLNITVAASLVMQTLFAKCPEARGDLSDADKASLRAVWYDQLSRHSEKKRDVFTSFLVRPPPPLDDIRRVDKELFHKPTKTDGYASSEDGYSSSGSGGSAKSRGSSPRINPRRNKSYMKMIRSKDKTATEDGEAAKKKKKIEEVDPL